MFVYPNLGITSTLMNLWVVRHYYVELSTRNAQPPCDACTQVKRDNDWREVSSDELVPGDTVKVQRGLLACDMVCQTAFIHWSVDAFSPHILTFCRIWLWLLLFASSIIIFKQQPANGNTVASAQRWCRCIMSRTLRILRATLGRFQISNWLCCLLILFLDMKHIWFNQMLVH